MKKYILGSLCLVCLVGLIITLITCGGAADEESGGTTATTTTTTLKSTDMTAAAASLSLVKNTLSSTCDGELVNCLTPTSVSGKVYYGGIMIGGSGEEGGESGYSLGPIIGDVTDPSPATSYAESDLLSFNFGTELAIEGGIVCCGGSTYPSDAAAIVTRIEIYFGYVDVTFTLAESDGVAEALVGTHQIRTYFADIDDTSYQQGDLLYRTDSSSDFMWCATVGSCTHTTRPETGTLQNSAIANYEGSEDGLGSQTIPSFAANLSSGHDSITITETQAENYDFAATIDFQMTNAIGWTSDITAFDTIDDMVGAFTLAAEPGSTDGGFTTTIAVTLTENEGANSPEEEGEEE